MDNIILVDTSYTSFHRFFATLRWFSLANKDIYKEHKEDTNYDWSKNDIFIEKYEKMYLESIKKLVKPKVFNKSTIIFCMDSPQEELWRHEYIECYKGNRTDLTKKANFKPTFDYTYKKIIPKLIKEDNIFSIMIKKIEGDDVIAIASKYIRTKYPNKKVYIVSGDKDFYQLGYPNLYFADYKKKELLNFTRKEAKNELLLKIINGDCSDNIPSIFVEKISNKMKKELREDKEKLKNYINENPTVRKQYKINKRIISFKYIPKKYQKIALTEIKQIL